MKFEAAVVGGTLFSPMKRSSQLAKIPMIDEQHIALLNHVIFLSHFVTFILSPMISSFTDSSQSFIEMLTFALRSFSISD